VKDNDGQEVRLSMSVQYKLQRENLVKLYLEFQKAYEVTYMSFIDSTVRKVVGDFNSQEFWKDRKQAGDMIRDAVNARL